jgi:hypothetical protein
MITTIREISQFNGRISMIDLTLHYFLMTLINTSIAEALRIAKTTTQTLLPMSYFTLEIQLLS